MVFTIEAYSRANAMCRHPLSVSGRKTPVERSLLRLEYRRKTKIKKTVGHIYLVFYTLLLCYIWYSTLSFYHHENRDLNKRVRFYYLIYI